MHTKNKRQKAIFQHINIYDVKIYMINYVTLYKECKVDLHILTILRKYVSQAYS